jgi:hypothetical protein
MLVGLPTAQAADTTLTCKGTKSWETSGARKSSEGVNIGIRVDLQNKTLVGLEPTDALGGGSLFDPGPHAGRRRNQRRARWLGETRRADRTAAAAAGAISDMTTARAWTGAEFKAVGDKASKAASAYRLPGKS